MSDELDPFIEPRRLTLEGVSVALAVPCKEDTPWKFTFSYGSTIARLGEVRVPFLPLWGTGGTAIPWARNRLAYQFLKTNASRLFMIDSDMSWKPEDFIKFLAMSTKMDVVCGAYACKKDPPIFMFGEQDFAAGMRKNEWGCLPINGLGLGFCVVTREVIQKLSDQAPLVTLNGIDEPIPEVFRFAQTPHPELTEKYGRPVFTQRGEDMDFFKDCRAAGYGVWLDPDITLGHTGPKTYEYQVPARKVAQHG